MGIIETMRAAIAPSSIALAMRAPKRLPRIGRSGPPLAHVLPPLNPYSRLIEYGALEADPQRWFSVMERADSGDTGPMMDLFSDARDRDPHLDGVARKRQQSMMGRPIVWRPPDGFEDDEEANEAAQFTRRILLSESRAFRSRLTYLMSGAVNGYAAAPLRWTTNASGDYVPHIFGPGRVEEGFVHPNRYAFDRDSRQIGFYASQFRNYMDVKKLSDYPDCFVAHIPMSGRADYPWRRGPMRSCIVPSFIKRMGLKFWLTLAERFGMPQPYALVPPGMDHDGQSSDDTIAVTREALRNLQSTWSAVFTKGIEINSIPGSGEAKAEVHEALINWAETTESVSLLGQNLTTKVDGGSFAAAESHRYVAGDLHLSDSVELGDTITQQINEAVIRYNMPGAPVPVCEVSTGQKQVFTTEHVKEGIASPDEMRRTMGHEAIPDGAGKDYRRPVTVQVPAQIGPEIDVDVAELDDEPAPGETIETEPTATNEATAKDPSTALNGAQVSALLEIVAKVVEEQLPRDSAKALILAAFPLSDEQAEKILGTVGKTFEPAPEAAPPAPFAP